MKKKVVIGVIILIILVVGFLGLNSIKTIGNTQTTDSEAKEVGSITSNVEGPGGCVGEACNQYCQENQEECNEWCENNKSLCEELMKTWGSDNFQEEPPHPDEEIKEGDGFWDKNELTFYIKDEEKALSDNKKKVIRETIFSVEESGGGFWGWNSALEELNKLYPENSVPDKFIEIDTEENADFLIIANTEKEFCCDYGGDPVKGRERSEIDSNNIKIVSKINLYDIVDIDSGFLGDITRHEIGHGLGLFSHVTDRENDLMSIVSPDSEIKEGNLNDLYIKYRDRIIESNEEAIEKDLDVKDEKVGFQE